MSASRWLMVACLLVSALGVPRSGMAEHPGVPDRSIRECATCHPAQAKPHPVTSMAHAMELPAECEILKSHPVLSFRSGSYSYRLERQGDMSIYSVSDGVQTISVPIGWA